MRSTYTQYKTPYYRAKVHLEMPEVVPACTVTKCMALQPSVCCLGVTHSKASPLLHSWGQERLPLQQPLDVCLDASGWPRSGLKAGRLTLIAILIKCYPSYNYDSRRILTGMLESVLLFSLPSYPLNAFLQMLAML